MMKMNKTTSFILGITLFLASCAKNDATVRDAQINDVAVPSELDSGYMVVAIDGRPEKRVKGIINTYVPFVVIAPGEHTLTIQKRPYLNSKEKISGKVKVESGLRYRLQV